jgi:hypothetical protein
MLHPVDTKDRYAVENEVSSFYLKILPSGDPSFIPRVFGWVLDCFQGRYRDYQPIDVLYHDLEHTLQGTLCMARLLWGYHRAQALPSLEQRMVELGLTAILLHDTGYLKKRSDSEGTGAKYTLIHVSRSADFAQQLLSEKGFPDPEIAAVRRMIRCTGVGADLKAINFASVLERKIGFSLSTADLLGQMAADDYVDKLPVLYSEFAESSRFYEGKTGPLGTFDNADDLMHRTPLFWEKYVLPKIDGDFEGLYRFLNDPYPDGPNDYVERIKRNINRLRRRFAHEEAA